MFRFIETGLPVKLTPCSLWTKIFRYSLFRSDSVFCPTALSIRPISIQWAPERHRQHNTPPTRYISILYPVNTEWANTNTAVNPHKVYNTNCLHQRCVDFWVTSFFGLGTLPKYIKIHTLKDTLTYHKICLKCHTQKLSKVKDESRLRSVFNENTKNYQFFI